jgi:hypothetical protein
MIHLWLWSTPLGTKGLLDVNCEADGLYGVPQGQVAIGNDSNALVLGGERDAS